MERLSGLDASFLYLETPETPLHVAMVAVLDPAQMPGGYTFEKIVALIASRVDLVRPFKRRLAQVPFNLDHPVWVDDPHFDIVHHVKQVALPAPGGMRELGAMAGRIISTPLDRSRPLWEAWVIEGLEQGRVALITKVHHAAVDGASGAGLLVHLFDLSREAPAASPSPSRPAAVIPTDADLVRGAIRSRLEKPEKFVRLVQRTAQVVGNLLRRGRDPDVIRGATPLTAPRTHFNAATTARRNVAFARIPLGEVKNVKRVFGTTVNDVVLAICAGALRRYLEGRHALPKEPLIAVVPISVRGPGDEDRITNRVSGLFTSLATNVSDPTLRLLAIQSVTRGAKDTHNAIGADMLQNWAEFAAPNTFHIAARFYTRFRLADLHRPVHNVVISNVPGPPFPLYLAGAEVVAAYALGPVMQGAGLNITVMSYHGSLDFGFTVSADLVPDVWDLAAAVEPAMRELRDAAADHVTSATTTAGG
ncbi:MAG TPA: wax ester/triacylglycerol synthase family O-acyltransferase [Polyangiaceae bacterium]